MPRLFTGIHIKENAEIFHLQESLKLRLPKSRINWVARENFHITLRFLGETEDLYLNSICLALQKAASQIESFRLKPMGTGFFGSKKQPGVIWYGYQECAEIKQLVSLVNENLYQLGFPKEGKPYRPHLTLGRVKTITELQEFETLMQEYKEMRVNEIKPTGFSLFRSDLKPTGPVYKELKYFPFKSD